MLEKPYFLDNSIKIDSKRDEVHLSNTAVFFQFVTVRVQAFLIIYTGVRCKEV